MTLFLRFILGTKVLEKCENIIVELNALRRIEKT
jgi:hypothetical protein